MDLISARREMMRSEQGSEDILASSDMAKGVPQPPIEKPCPEGVRKMTLMCIRPEVLDKYAPRLPLKLLAARSGLAVYGKNNICYVEGMGSFLTLVSYFSDLPCAEDNWQEIRLMDDCSDCQVCLSNCPTGAIQRDRFLIDNERCLSYFNEAAGDFPEWLPRSAHHCLYDCLKCQLNCPQNRDYIDNVIGPIEFDAEETGMLLDGKPMREFPPALKRKARLLGMDSWLDVMPRNMMVLFDMQ